MTEQVLDNNEVEVTRELWHLASEADRSLKAVLFSIHEDAGGGDIMPTEMRRDIRRAAQAHYAIVQFLHDGKYHWPPVREDMTDEGAYSNIAASSVAFLLRSDRVRQTEQRLNFADLGTPQEPLFLDRYSAWLREPGEQRVDFSPHLENDAEVLRWHIQAMANFYSLR